MTAIDEIKARLDIVDIVSENVQLKRSGKNYTGFCPFHANTRTPAFVVFQETGTWRCFGECNDGGDIFKYVMKKEGYDFPEALRVLAERAGVELKPQTPQQQAQYEEYDRLRELMEEAVTFYRHNLQNTSAGREALKYLHERGLNDETIEAFGMGYAPKSWDATTNHFKSKGYTVQDLIDAGMVSQRDSGGVYDRFRHRVMIPIRDERGRMAAFGARMLDPDDMPKYLNSPQTDIFDKGHILFGLDKARRAIRLQDQVVIVEGYMGVLAPHQHNYSNVVATMGTALTEDHLRLIKRFTRNIVLAMDSDAAGMKATLRGLEVARQTLDREAEVQFDARGLMRQEARLQADIRVTTLPPGMDPDDVIKNDPQEWERLIATAKPIVFHVMETLAANRDLDDPKTKTEIAQQVMPLIADVPSSIERDAYRQQLARLLKVDERSLLGPASPRKSRSRYSRRRASTQKPQTTAGSATLFSSAYRRESHVLGVLVRRPELIYHIDRGLKEHGLEPLSAHDFQHTDHQVIYRLIHQSLEQGESEPLNYVLNHLPEEMMSAVDQILADTEKIDPESERVLEDILRTVVIARLQNVNQQLDYLRYAQEDLQAEGDLKASQYQSTMGQYAELLGRLHKAQNTYTNRSLST
jgi:DNA primase